MILFHYCLCHSDNQGPDMLAFVNCFSLPRNISNDVINSYVLKGRTSDNGFNYYGWNLSSDWNWVTATCYSFSISLALIRIINVCFQNIAKGMVGHQLVDSIESVFCSSRLCRDWGMCWFSDLLECVFVKFIE